MPFSNHLRDRERDKFEKDIDGDTAVRVVRGKDLQSLFQLVNSAGFLDGETYDGFLCEENPISEFKTFHFFNQGEETFSIVLGFNSDLDIGAVKITPTDNITKTFFVQGTSYANEPIGSLIGLFFAVGGNNVVFTILQDLSGLFALDNNNELISLAPVPAGTYDLVVKAEGIGTQYIDQFQIIIGETALISNINLSNLSVEDGAPSGTTVGALTTAGGESPISYSILAQVTEPGDVPIDIFELDGSTLKTKDDVDAIGTTYRVFIQAEDSRSGLPDNERLKAEEFVIEVVEDTFINSNSLIFDGVDESLEVADDISLWGNQKFSGSFWCKPNNIGASQYVVSHFREGGKRSWGLRVNATGSIAMIYSQTGVATDTTTTVATVTFADWNHVVFAFDGTLGQPKMKIWINGALAIDEDTALTGLYNTDVPMYIGALGTLILAVQSTESHFDGNIDEASIYNEVLTQTDVDEIYNAGEPTNLLATASGGDIISWWRMGDDFVGGVQPDDVGSNDGIGTNMNNSNKSTDVP
jgi:hypothetical protein